MLQRGWSQESIVGANLEWPQGLKIASKIDNEPTEFIGNGLRYFGYASWAEKLHLPQAN